MANVTFDPNLRRIAVTTAPDASGSVVVDVQKDLYSEAKRQWLSDPALVRSPFPLRVVGGDPLGGSLRAGAYFFLDNVSGWRVVPYPADHEAVFHGNLYREDTNIPLFSSPGVYEIAIRLETSSLTQMVDGGGGGDVNVVSVGGVAVAGPDDLKADVSAVGLNAATQSQIDDIQSRVRQIFGVEFGGWSIEDDGAGNAQWVIYDTDNTTVLARFDLDSKLGRAIFADIPNETFMTRRRV